MGRLSFHAVYVHAAYAMILKIFFQLFLDLFGTEILLHPCLRSACRACHQFGIGTSAIVTMQFVAVLMERKRYIAVYALRDIAAGAANKIWIITPTVLKEDNLFASSEGRFDPFFQLRTDHYFGLLIYQPCIDDLDHRQEDITITFKQGYQSIFS